MGSKNRIAKEILPIMLKEVNENNLTTWIEPFVGGANMIDKVPPTIKRIGIDYNPHTIQALIAVRDLVNDLPNECSEEYYSSLKKTEPNPITSWLRFVCSFGGKFENGYSREKDSDDKTFTGYGKRNAIKQSPNLQGVDFINGSYEDYSDFENCLI